jgi:hypothetical protein
MLEKGVVRVEQEAIMPWLIAGIVFLVVALWPPTPRALGRLARRLLGYTKILPRAKRNRTDYLRWLVRRPALFAAVNAYEASFLAGNGVDLRLKYLASLKASSLTGCPF